MDTSLEGKVAIVTGGSRGIGKAIAAAFAAEGANVMITSRDADVGSQAAAEIGHGCTFSAGNVGRAETAEKVISETLAHFGRIDVLVNNAATNPYAGPVIDTDIARWEKTISTNLTAPLVWSQMVWNRWMKDNGGNIINISSVGAHGTSGFLGSYNITKSALIHLTQQLAAELGPKVRVNAIAPGLIKTDFARVLWDGGRGDNVAKAYPLKRLGEPEDIAHAALYLATDASGWFTGQTMTIDGGGIVAFRDG